MKKLVIIGGGFAGSQIARKLENKFDTILIDTKDYFEFTPGILRTLVEPGHAKKIQIKHRDYLAKTNIKLGKVTGFDSNAVFIGEKKISFDYLVIASGSRYSFPIKHKNIILPNRVSELVSANKRLQKSKTIVIIGGGLVGVELAGEICAKYNKKKKIIIIHSKDRLLGRNAKKVSDYAKRFLIKKGVNILLNEKALRYNEHIETNKGTKIKPDLAFICTGIIPNSEFVKNNLKNERGYVAVNDYLQLNNFKNIFAVGDLTSVREEKTAQNAEKHADLIVDNILALEKNHELKKYKSSSRFMIISLGKNNGIILKNNFMIVGFFSGLAKTIFEWIFMKRFISHN